MNTPRHGSAPKSSSRTADKFVVRMPDGMRELIAKHAEANHRSMNSEIVRCLQQVLGDETTPIEPVTSIQPGSTWTPSLGALVQVKGEAGIYILQHFHMDSSGRVSATLTSALTQNSRELPLQYVCPVILPVE